MSVTVTVFNRSANNLVLGPIGTVPSWSSKTKTLTNEEFSGIEDDLIRLKAEGKIGYTTNSTDSGAQSELHLYVNNSTGNDTNDGRTSSQSYRTIARAMMDIPSVLVANHFIHLANTGTDYSSAGMDRPVVCAGGSLVFVGEGRTTLSTGTITTATSKLIFQDSTKSWTADEFIGKSVRFTSGSAEGFYRTLTENTATSFEIANLCAYGSTPNPQAGDTYEIFEPAVRINVGGGKIYGGIAATAFAYPASFAGFDGTSSSDDEVAFVNLKLSGVGRIDGLATSFSGSIIESYGVLGQLSGITSFGLGRNYGLFNMSANDLATAGWGLYLPESTSYAGGTLIGAGLVARQIILSGDSSQTQFKVWSGRITGGSLYYEAPLNFGTGSDAWLASGGNGVPRVIIKPVAGSTPAWAFAIQVGPGSVCKLSNNCHILLEGFGVSGIECFGSLNLDGAPASAHPYIEVDSGEYTVHAKAGGRVLCNGNNLSRLTANNVGTNAMAVGIGASLTTGNTGSGGSFATNGSFLAADDGSVIARADEIA